MLASARNSIPTGSHKRQSSRSEEERRGMAAEERVHKGQVSRARQELVGSPLAPKNEATLRELRERRPQKASREIPREVLDFVPHAPLELSFKLFSISLRSAPAGSSPGPGGCTNEMLKVCLDDQEPFNCCSVQPTSLPEGMCLVVWAIVSLWRPCRRRTVV